MAGENPFREQPESGEGRKWARGSEEEAGPTGGACCGWRCCSAFEADASKAESISSRAWERSSVMSLQEGGAAEGGARRKDPREGGGRVGRACCRWGAEGKPAKLKLCLRRGGRPERKEPGWERPQGVEDVEDERGCGCSRSSSLLWTKWQRIP